MANGAAVRDRCPSGIATMVPVMTPEATRRIVVTNVVRMRAPTNVHGRKHVVAIDGEQSPCSGSDLGTLAIPDRWICVELLPARLVPLDLGQSADAMALKTTMKRRANELRDRSLQGMQAVIERQEGVLAKGDDDGFLFHG